MERDRIAGKLWLIFSSSNTLTLVKFEASCRLSQTLEEVSAVAAVITETTSSVRSARPLVRSAVCQLFHSSAAQR